MKSLIITAAVLASAAIAAPAFAQDRAGPTIASPQAYMNMGYTGTNPNGHGIGEVTGRFGLRLGRFWGAEGELGTGVSGDAYRNSAGVPSKLSQGPEAAIYGVGYLPLMGDKLDLIGRVGYGTELYKLESGGVTRINTSHSVNYGAGAQYMLTGKDGVRVDYTRRDFQESNAPKDDDTWTVSYVRKF
jgi:outer membrane immunogenic protein